MDNPMVDTRQRLVPTTLNLTESTRDYMQAAAAATGRSMSGWLRRLLERMQQGHSPVVAGPAVSMRAPVSASEPPAGSEWMLVEVTEADVGKEAWMRASDAMGGGR